MPDAQQPGLFDHLPDASWSRGPSAKPESPKSKAPPKAASSVAPTAPAPLPLWRDKAPEAPAPVAPPPAVAAAPPAPLPPAVVPPEAPAHDAPTTPRLAERPQPTAPTPVASSAWVLNAQCPSPGQAALAIALDGRPHRLLVGPDGLKLLRGDELVGESGWAAFGAYLGHQRARMATLIGSRRVPASLFDHPDFASGILPHLYVNAYHGDRLSRGGLRRRVEVRASELDTVERLMAVEVACANPDCLHAIHPFRPRAKGNPLRLFVGFTCPLEESVACARTRGAKEAMEALVLKVEALGQVAGNDVQR